jgi:hypothetical protein
LETALRVATLISGIATFAGLLVAIFVYKRQTNAQIFMEYTRRYEEVMGGLPSHARTARTNSGAVVPPSSDELTYQMLRYLNLCSEEFYLRKRGYLAAEIWGIWEGELRRTLATPLLRREWTTLRQEFASYPEFQRYVDAAQGQMETQAT